MSDNYSPCGALLFPGLTYADALRRVLDDGATRYTLRDRIRADQERDPVDCVTDAEVLLALNQLRLREATT